MQRRLLTFAILFGLASPPVVAHGGGAHLKGTISALSAESVTIKAAGGSAEEAKITDHTVFMRGKAAGKASDLKVGDRVVVHTHKEGNTVEATEIHYATRSKSARY